MVLESLISRWLGKLSRKLRVFDVSGKQVTTEPVESGRGNTFVSCQSPALIINILPNNG